MRSTSGGRDGCVRLPRRTHPSRQAETTEPLPGYDASRRAARGVEARVVVLFDLAISPCLPRDGAIGCSSVARFAPIGRAPNAVSADIVRAVSEAARLLGDGPPAGFSSRAWAVRAPRPAVVGAPAFGLGVGAVAAADFDFRAAPDAGASAPALTARFTAAAGADAAERDFADVAAARSAGATVGAADDDAGFAGPSVGRARRAAGRSGGASAADAPLERRTRGAAGAGAAPWPLALPWARRPGLTIDVAGALWGVGVVLAADRPLAGFGEAGSVTTGGFEAMARFGVVAFGSGPRRLARGSGRLGSGAGAGRRAAFDVRARPAAGAAGGAASTTARRGACFLGAGGASTASGTAGATVSTRSRFARVFRARGAVGGVASMPFRGCSVVAAGGDSEPVAATSRSIASRLAAPRAAERRRFSGAAAGAASTIGVGASSGAATALVRLASTSAWASAEGSETSGIEMAGGSADAEVAVALRARRRRSGSSASSRPTQKWCLRIVGSATTEIIGSAKIWSGLTWQQLAGRPKRSA